MSGFAGVRLIARLNWPWYAAGAAGLLSGSLALARSAAGGPAAALGLATLLVSGFWLVASLVVSHLVYDRSGIARGAWLDGVEPAGVRHAAVFHAGHDEASAVAARALPDARIDVFDFHLRGSGGTPSLRRARAAAASRATDRRQGAGGAREAGDARGVSDARGRVEPTAIAPERVPLADGVLDLGLLVFAAHEIRRHSGLVAFLRELARVLAPGGRLLVVEHLRDGPNLLAYGPGAWHFLPRSAWMRGFGEAGLRLVAESACTPFVRIFELGRA